MKNYLFELVATTRTREGYFWYIPPEYAFEFNIHNIFVEDSRAYPTEAAAKAAFTRTLTTKLRANPNIQLEVLF